MVFEVREGTGESCGAVARVATVSIWTCASRRYGTTCPTPMIDAPGLSLRRV